MFESVLVANRGEIAVRICKTLRTMGIRSVVVASIPDRRSLAVRSADAWVLLEGNSAAESYLDIDAIIAAAKAKGCQAIHPGYGFLSERADFAERCAAAGITFIGPSPAVLRALGDKSSARRLAVRAGVPVVPGWDGADDEATLLREGTNLGFPLMVKARGGGGGRGMREVHAPDDLPEAIASARREAASAFGDPGLLLEKLVTEAHHVEIQVFGDNNGHLIHLGERDCSVQRRRQKLIEESPSPVVDDELRSRLTTAALRLAGNAGYTNAGTVEFLVGPAPADGGGRPFYFLEVNPRLQVEHPVTEMVTGLDLVEMQLRVADGEPLQVSQEAVKFEGHAIELRINAEDPWNDFRPSTGRIASASAVLGTANDGGLNDARADSGFEEGDTVPPQYDSLLAKVIVHGRSRAEAVMAVDVAANVAFYPLTLNTDLLQAILRSPDFGEGLATVGWLEPRLTELLATALPPDEWWAAAGLGLTELHNSFRPHGRKSPYSRQAGWHGAGPCGVWIGAGSATRFVQVAGDGPLRAVVRVEGRAFSCAWTSPELAGLRVGAVPVAALVGYRNIGSVEIGADGKCATFTAVPPPPLPRRARAATAGATAITAPLSGTIVDVRVVEGDVVEAGQLLALLEAMKMEHRIVATSAGTVKAVPVKARDTVREGDLLVELG